MNHGCKCNTKLVEEGISNYRIIDVRGVESGLKRHFISIPSDQVEDMGEPFKIERKDLGRGSTLICFDSEGCEVCNTIISEGSFLLTGTHMEGSSFIYSFISPNYTVFQRVIEKIEQSLLEVNVLKLEKFMRQGDVLTENQEKTLWIALKSGFFEYPRRLTMKQLAEKIGKSSSTLSETLRRATSKVITAYFLE
jgi:predicted DNA binding protein